MRRTKWIVLILLLVVVAAPCVRADSVTFTCTGDNGFGGVCQEAAPTAPDVTFPGPTLEISWYTAANPSPFAVTLPSAWLDTQSYTWFASNDFFFITNLSLQQTLTTAITSTYLPGDVGLSEFGTLTFTPGTVAAPEPSTSAMLLLGVLGLVLVMGKRIARGLPQAT